MAAKGRVTALSLLLIVSGCSFGQGVAATRAEDLIVDGIGPDSDSASVIRRLGVPVGRDTTQHPFDAGAKLVAWQYPASGITVHLSGDGVAGVEITGSAVQTARGIRIGDSAAKVLEKYGPIDGAGNGELEYVVGNQDELQRIVFFIGGDRVERIYLGTLLD